jgi:hypothetical protein
MVRRKAKEVGVGAADIGLRVTHREREGFFDEIVAVADIKNRRMLGSFQRSDFYYGMLSRYARDPPAWQWHASQG